MCTEPFHAGYGLPAAVLRLGRAHDGPECQQQALWNHALVPDPTVWLPPPRLDHQVVWAVRPAQGCLEGPAYGDGSGKPPAEQRRLRCGWSVVQLVQQKGFFVLTAEIHGHLPGLHQDVPASEAYGFLMYLQHVGLGPYVYHTDCA